MEQQSSKSGFLKVLCWTTIACGLGSICSEFGLSFFAFGGYPRFGFLGGLFLFTCMFFIPLFLLIGVINLIAAVNYFGQLKICALKPVALFLAGIALIIVSNVVAHLIIQQKFFSDLDEYKQVVSMILQEKISADENGFISLPPRYGNLAYLTKIYDEPNNVIITFEVGSAGVFGHTVYIYSANGDIAKGTHVYKAWPHPKMLTDHWFRGSH